MCSLRRRPVPGPTTLRSSLGSEVGRPATLNPAGLRGWHEGGWSRDAALPLQPPCLSLKHDAERRVSSGLQTVTSSRTPNSLHPQCWAKEGLM